MVQTYRPGVRSPSPVSRLGITLCVLSGLAFAVQPVLGQVALDRGLPLTSLLGWRYAIAALTLGIVARRRLVALPAQMAILAFSMGLVFYAADSALFYAALERTSAPLASLLHYAHLAAVVGIAAAIGRERLQLRRVLALAGVLSGVALVGGGAAHPDALGVTMALAAAGIYSGYILVADHLLRDVDPVAFATLLTAGAATAFLACGAWRGTVLDVGGTTGAGLIATTALVGSVFAVTAFLSGIRLVGPGTASLLVTIEVPIGLTLAAVVLDQRLRPAQLVGAALVVGAIALLQLRRPSALRFPGRLRRARAVEVPGPVPEPA